MARITVSGGSTRRRAATWVVCRLPAQPPRRSAHVAWCWLSLVITFLPTAAWAAGGKASQLDAVADTRDLAPGFTKFLADTYNANLWLYGLYVVLIMGALGLVLGLGVDKLIGLTGINLGKIKHHE